MRGKAVAKITSWINKKTLRKEKGKKRENIYILTWKYRAKSTSIKKSKNSENFSKEKKKQCANEQFALYRVDTTAILF